MNVCFELSGSILFQCEMSSVPQIGSVVRLRTQQYKKGLYAGSFIEFEVGRHDAPTFDLIENVCYISVNGYTVIELGPKPEGD